MIRRQRSQHEEPDAGADDDLPLAQVPAAVVGQRRQRSNSRRQHECTFGRNNSRKGRTVTVRSAFLACGSWASQEEIKLCAEMFGISESRFCVIDGGDSLTADEFARVGRCPAGKVPRGIIAGEIEDIEASLRDAVDGACKRIVVDESEGWSEVAPSLSSFRRISPKHVVSALKSTGKWRPQCEVVFKASVKMHWQVARACSTIMLHCARLKLCQNGTP